MAFSCFLYAPPQNRPNLCKPAKDTKAQIRRKYKSKNPEGFIAPRGLNS